MVKILSDSTCDLSKELLDRYGVGIIPLHIVLGDREYRDGLEITPDEIYRWSDENRTTPKTSAVSPEDAMQAMKPHLEAGDDIVVFCISEEMSTTGNVLRMAAEELDASERVAVIDSRNLSTGIGLQVIEAAVLAKAGKSKEEIVETIRNVTPLVRASFVVDTLLYLYRGGRCSGLAAMAGGMLKLHPKIEVNNGVMGAKKKYRGKPDSVILNYVKDLEPELKKARKERVFITHSGCPEETVEQVKAYLESLDYFEEILITRAGGVISSHCGPGTLGVLFIGQEETT